MSSSVLDGRRIHKQSVIRNVTPWYKQKVKCHQETQTFEFCLFKSVEKFREFSEFFLNTC